MRNLITLSGLSRSELASLITLASARADQLNHGRRHTDELRGKVVTSLFLEASTRTRLSFEQAARFLGADVMTFDPATSSAQKGESLEDTARTLAAIGTDLFVVRHTREDGPTAVALATGIPVVSGGAGRKEHPTQTLLDAVTLQRRFGGIAGLTMAIVGDVVNSRVAGSHLIALPTLGVQVILVGPKSLLPGEVPQGVRVSEDLDAVLPGLDVIYMLRIQKERGADTGFDTDGAYSEAYGLDARRAAMLPSHAVVMHPGPMNRGVEIADQVADGPRSLIEEQVSMGVPTRMAVLAGCLEDAR